MVASSKPTGTPVYRQKLIQQVQYQPTVEHVQRIQQKGTVHYQHPPVFNAVQLRLFNEALYGLYAYKPKEIAKISKSNRNYIMTKTRKVQKILSLWYNDLKYREINSLLTSLFPRSKTAKVMITMGYDKKVVRQEDMVKLGVTPKDVAERLVQNQLLPENFFQL
jgi:hypothetical protein